MQPGQARRSIRGRSPTRAAWLPAVLSALIGPQLLAAERAPAPASVDAPRSGGELEALLDEDLAFARRLGELLARPALRAGLLGQELGLEVERAALDVSTLRLDVHARAGTGRLRARLTAFEGVGCWQVFQARLHFSTDAEVDGHDAPFVTRRFKDALRSAWQVPFEEVENGFVLRWEDQALVRQREASLVRSSHEEIDLARWRGRHLQEPEPRSTEELQRVYELLSSPFTPLRATVPGGRDSLSADPGQLLADDLATAERWDLLRRLLRSLNPVSRILAARSLRQRDRLDLDDMQVLAALRRSPVILEYSSPAGCVVQQATAAMLLDLTDPFANVIEEMIWRADAEQAVVEIRERWVHAEPRFESGRLVLFRAPLRSSGRAATR